METVNDTIHGHELAHNLAMAVLPVTVFISIEAFLGFFGNITIILVYFNRCRRTNFQYFVLALAVVDLASCCTALPGEVFSMLNWYDYQYAWICKLKSFFNVWTAWGSASILLILAIDRYRKICHPCAWQIRFLVAFRLCILCLLSSATVASPVVVLWGKQTYIYEYEGSNVTVSVCEKSGEYAATIYPLLYVCGVYIVPVSIMIVVAMTLNFITAWRLFGHHSMNDTRIVHRQMKEVAAITLTSESSVDGTNEKEETKSKTSVNAATDEDNCTDMFGQTDCSINGRRVIDKNITNDKTDFKKIKEASTDEASNDEEHTDDFSSSVDHITSDRRNQTTNQHRQTRRQTTFHRKRKTLIMLILTTVFAVTMATYIVLTLLIAKPDSILKYMPDSEKVAFFFFWRLYFVNSVINPILYGFMDPGFRSGLMSYMRRNKQTVTTTS